MTAVTLHEENLPAQSEAQTIVSIIQHAARDPGADVDKLKELLEMHERVKAREARREFGVAMKLAQAEMRPVARDCENPQTRSRYASYGALDNAMRPIYSAHGFCVTFNTADGAPPDYVRVTATVRHDGGHEEPYHIDMPADGKGARGGDVMTRTHATGSAVTYGRRYLLQMIFNIVAGDDDGNAAGGRPVEKITEGQVANLQRLLTENDCDRAAFLDWANLKWSGVRQLGDIPARGYQDCLNAIHASGRRRRGQ